jgi:hypothetical protein
MLQGILNWRQVAYHSRRAVPGVQEKECRLVQQQQQELVAILGAAQLISEHRG